MYVMASVSTEGIKGIFLISPWCNASCIVTKWKNTGHT